MGLRFVVPAVLLLVALIHALPVAGVLGAQSLAELYGIDASEPSLQILLRHRAVLFGILAGFLAVAAFRPRLHRWALAAAVVSVGSFLLLAVLVGSYNDAVARVVRVDAVALVLLLVASGIHARQARK